MLSEKEPSLASEQQVSCLSHLSLIPAISAIYALHALYICVIKSERQFPFCDNVGRLISPQLHIYKVVVKATPSLESPNEVF